MSVTLRHPFALDAAGAVVTIPQSTPRHAVEIARHVVECRIGERGLAPDWGLPDPVAEGVDVDDVYAAVDLCEPDVLLTYVDIIRSDQERVDILIDATWRPSE